MARITGYGLKFSRVLAAQRDSGTVSSGPSASRLGATPIRFTAKTRYQSGTELQNSSNGVLGVQKRMNSSFMKPLVVLAVPGLYLFYKYNQYRRQQQERQRRKVTEKELLALNQKIFCRVAEASGVSRAATKCRVAEASGVNRAVRELHKTRSHSRLTPATWPEGQTQQCLCDCFSTRNRYNSVYVNAFSNRDRHNSFYVTVSVPETDTSAYATVSVPGTDTTVNVSVPGTDGYSEIR
ncbi:sodium-independent organic anion transmembrane transporter, partial [Branchiostoma belcheri]